jgi:lycopene beta-cyclase
MSDSPHVVLVGGGLANGLIALRLKQRRPDLRVLVIEQADHLGGNHTWSFHSADLTPEQLAWLRPVVTRSWPAYRVYFPEIERRLAGGYHSVSSRHFHDVLCAELGSAVRLACPVRALAPHEVVLGDGSRIDAPCVIDGRGFADDRPLVAGYQKFLGLDLELEEPHGEPEPILMDGRVQQGSQLRFFYTLPWSDRRIQVGEARYSDSPHVDAEEFREGIAEYLKLRGWKSRSVERQEIGVLPAPLEGEWYDVAGGGDVPRSGVRAGLFHATTGYSLPYAVRFADALSELSVLESAAVLDTMTSMSQREWRRARYFRLLNRMLFRAAKPHERIAMFQQFYRRPERLIERFYASRLEPLDYLRIMTGKPPVSLLRAAQVFLGLR